MKIYTTTGDDGTTGLLGGIRVEKTSARIAAIGDVDELNAGIGLAVSLGAEPSEDLRRIQSALFEMGAELASPGTTARTRTLGQEDVAWLESQIDIAMTQSPPLRAFVLPAGVAASSALHLARAVCRRAERSVLALRGDDALREVPRIYLNRLSDYLFALARSANAMSNVSDVEWHRGRSAYTPPESQA